MKCGRRARDISYIEERLQAIKIGHRTTFRRMDMKSGISKSSLHLAVKSGALVRHSICLKPIITEKNKLELLKCASDHVKFIPRKQKYEFADMTNLIHVDEKCFHDMKEEDT